jgi:hypothetical protein
MTMRGLREETQRDYIRFVRGFGMRCGDRGRWRATRRRRKIERQARRLYALCVREGRNQRNRNL